MTIRMRRAHIAAMAMQAMWGNEHWMMRVLLAELEDNK